LRTLLDSTGWIEFFTAGPLANRYAPYLSEKDLITPTIVLYEVYKKIKRERGEPDALLAAGRMSATPLVPLTQSIALHAADVGLKHGLAMADAIVYATALDQDAQLVTGDSDLKNLPGVVYIS
jgi:predicted nucleic acid-binding protein